MCLPDTGKGQAPFQSVASEASSPLHDAPQLPCSPPTSREHGKSAQAQVPWQSFTPTPDKILSL